MADRLVAAVRLRAGALLHVDLLDPPTLRAVRARVIAVSAPIGAVSDVASWLSKPDGDSNWVLGHAGILVVTLLTAAIAGLRRERLGEPIFLLLLSLNGAVATAAVMVGMGMGLASQTTVSLLPTSLVAALFCARARAVVALVLVNTALLWSVVLTSSGGAQVTSDAATGIFALLLVSFVVRYLREVAFTSLRMARLGEVTDPLTGLANRRGLERSGAARWSELAREGLPVAALVVDVDHFKRINDAQGHAAGDDVLRRLGELLAQTVRAGDVAVRLGGEEFLVLCAVPPGGASAVAERLRSTVERELAPVTVSIGVHESLPGGQDPLPDAIWSAVDLADRALYLAKQGGRNRAVLFEPSAT